MTTAHAPTLRKLYTTLLASNFQTYFVAAVAHFLRGDTPRPNIAVKKFEANEAIRTVYVWEPRFPHFSVCV
jgi:hypothetical protein